MFMSTSFLLFAIFRGFQLTGSAEDPFSGSASEPPELWSQWAPASKCSATCGPGKMRWRRTCLDEGAADTPFPCSELEVRPCLLDSCSFCEPVESPENGWMNRHGNTVNYGCDVNFQLRGKRKRLCVDGKWSGTKPTCTRALNCSHTKECELACEYGFDVDRKSGCSKCSCFPGCGPEMYYVGLGSCANCTSCSGDCDPLTGDCSSLMSHLLPTWAYVVIAIGSAAVLSAIVIVVSCCARKKTSTISLDKEISQPCGDDSKPPLPPERPHALESRYTTPNLWAKSKIRPKSLPMTVKTPPAQDDVLYVQIEKAITPLNDIQEVEGAEYIDLNEANPKQNAGNSETRM